MRYASLQARLCLLTHPELICVADSHHGNPDQIESESDKHIEQGQRSRLDRGRLNADQHLERVNAVFSTGVNHHFLPANTTLVTEVYHADI